MLASATHLGGLVIPILIRLDSGFHQNDRFVVAGIRNIALFAAEIRIRVVYVAEIRIMGGYVAGIREKIEMSQEKKQAGDYPNNPQQLRHDLTVFFCSFLFG